MPHIRLLSKNEALPKYKQREAAIDALFEEIGIPVLEWKTRFVNALAKGAPKDGNYLGDVNTQRTIGERDKYKEVRYCCLLPNVEWPYEKGTICSQFEAYTVLEKGIIQPQGRIDEAGSTYYPGGHLNQRYTELWKNHYDDISITNDPEGDAAKVLAYQEEFMRQVAKTSAERKSFKETAPFKWNEVRREINEMTLWDVYDGDRPDITGYLQVGDHPLFAFALYSPSGKVLHTNGLDTRSVLFSKIEVIPVPDLDITKEMADKINAKLSQCEDGEAIGDALWREW